MNLHEFIYIQDCNVHIGTCENSKIRKRKDANERFMPISISANKGITRPNKRIRRSAKFICFKTE